MQNPRVSARISVLAARRVCVRSSGLQPSPRPVTGPPSPSRRALRKSALWRLACACALLRRRAEEAGRVRRGARSPLMLADAQSIHRLIDGAHGDCARRTADYACANPPYATSGGVTPTWRMTLVSIEQRVTGPRRASANGCAPANLRAQAAPTSAAGRTKARGTAAPSRRCRARPPPPCRAG
jgi:hypothetical protein